MWWLDSIRHVLIEDRGGHVIVTTDPTDTACDEVGIARVNAADENIEAAKYHRGAVAFLHAPVGEVDFAMNAEATNDPCDRIPGQFFNDHIGIRTRGCGAG